MTKSKDSKIKVGISVGDLNGIGLEVVLKTLSDNRINELCIPVVFASKKVIQVHSKALHLSLPAFHYTDDLSKLKASQTNVFECWEEDVKIEFGKENPEIGAYAHLSLKKAGEALKKGEVDVLLTAPINKKSIQAADFNFPGHTEYLQNLDEAEDSLMLMLSDRARIGVVTGHIPLKEVAEKITSDLILKKLTILNKSLKEDFGIKKPKIAVMGLNPHAGDNDLLGKEESDIIIPSIQQAKSIGIMAIGPFAADGFFGSSNYKNFDGILAMYHDQGLIPAKSFSFGDGVNFTAGLSFVRTSPDHGTAFEIAGKGEANETSFRNALYRSIDIIKNRRLNKELEEGALVINKARN